MAQYFQVVFEGEKYYKAVVNTWVRPTRKEASLKVYMGQNQVVRVEQGEVAKIVRSTAPESAIAVRGPSRPLLQMSRHV